MTVSVLGSVSAPVSAVAVAMTIVMSGPAARSRLHVPRTPGARPRRLLLIVVAASAVAVTLLLGPMAMVATGVVVAVVVSKRRARAVAAVSNTDVALTLDVLAGCLAAGASMPAALAAAQAAAPTALRESLAVAAIALGRGEDPAETWRRVGEDVPELLAVSRLCSRATTTGASVSAELHRFAAGLRTSLDSARRRRLQRASVWLVLPLGLCFLPAFVLVGVVPLVTGIVPAALHGH